MVGLGLEYNHEAGQIDTFYKISWMWSFFSIFSLTSIYISAEGQIRQIMGKGRQFTSINCLNTLQSKF